MEVDSSEYAKTVYQLLVNIEHYKAKSFDKNFKVNANSKKKLSQRQYKILFTMHVLKINTVSEIAKGFKQSTATISIIMSKLVDSGYLQKEYPSKSDDKRKVFFYITEKGNEALQTLSDEIIIGIEYFYKNFTKQQSEKFDAGLTDLEKIFYFQEEKYTCHLDTILESATMLITKRIVRVLLRMLIESEVSLSKVCAYNIITVRQFHILRIMIELNINTIGRMEEMLIITESTLSTALSRLVESGYLEKKYNQDTDARKIFFCVTEDGKKEYERIYQEMMTIIEESLEQRTKEKQKLLMRGFSNLNYVFKVEREKAL